MPWKAAVPSILFQLMPGQEAGNALANALFGAVNPSGKLPVSFPGSMNDTWLGNPVNPLQYPGTDRGKGWLEADYTENLLIGYRWYDQQNIEPLWPFGHGLSYTTFSYSNLVVTGSVSPTGGATVTATVTNSGSVAGAEVAQLYVGYPAAAGEPPKLLKGFNKVALAPGASAQVSFTLSASALSIWNVVSDSWQLVPGTYQVLVGSTSRDIRLTGTVTVTSA
jgi:beta-glucosidase